eukprot:14976441-Alexandrium_andersonii.AAC.1
MKTLAVRMRRTSNPKTRTSPAARVASRSRPRCGTSSGDAHSMTTFAAPAMSMPPGATCWPCAWGG